MSNFLINPYLFAPACTSTLEASQTAQDAGTQSELRKGSEIRYGGRVISGSSLIGETVSKLGFYLLRVGSPTGNATFDTANDAGTIQDTLGTVDVSTISDSASEWIEVENCDATHEMAYQDRVEIRYNDDSSDSSNYIRVFFTETTPVKLERFVYTTSYDDQDNRMNQWKVYIKS